MLAAGAITWANGYLLADQPEDLFSATVRIGTATGLAAAILAGTERLAPDLAVALAWAAVLTVLFVRVPTGAGKQAPTPLERALSLADSAGL